MSLDALVHALVHALVLALVHVLVYALVDVTGETGQTRAAKTVQETKLTACPIVLVGKTSKRVKQIGTDLISSRSYCSRTYKLLYSLVQSHPIC